MGHAKKRLLTAIYLACSQAVVLGILAGAPAQLYAQDATPTSGTEAPAANPGFIFWADNSLTVLHGGGFEVDPSEQSTLTFEHAHESSIGDVFLFVDWTSFHGKPDTDSTWYGEFGPRLSLGKMLDKDLSHTIFRRSLFEIKDVLLAGQYERGEDPDVAEAVLIGLGLDLDVREAGLFGGLGKFNYVQLNLYGRANLAEGAPDGISDMQVTMVASYPFQVGGSQFLVDGYFDWVLGLGSEKWAYHINPQMTMDVGAHWDMPKKLFVGVELDLWWNKYQIPDTASFNTNQQAISAMVKYHF